MGTEPTRGRDPAGTRRAVLDAAERLFAERGFAGTSIRDIASESGVSHPLVQHHFATKEGLYRAVFRRCSEEFHARFPEAVGEDAAPVDLRAEMTRLFGFVRSRGRLMRMVAWARLEGRDDLFPESNEPREAMFRRIEAGRRAGTIRADVDATALGIMLEALIFFWIENRAGCGRAGVELTDDAYLDQAIRLLERGVAPSG